MHLYSARLCIRCTLSNSSTSQQNLIMSGVASFSGRTTPQYHIVDDSAAPRGFRTFDSHTPARLAGWNQRSKCTCRQDVRVRFAKLTAEAPPLPGGKGSGMETVGDVMTSKKVFYAREDTTIDEALEILVYNSITGLPVLDEEEKVVGVVSDFDLLSLDHISGERQTSGIFPDISTDWPAFAEVQKLILKNHGRVIGDVMTPDPVTVGKETTLENAARMLLDKRIRRLPVVDEEGKLLGMFSRGDVIKAALKTRSLVRSVQDA